MLLINISEESWDNVFREYRGSMPNRSNSDYGNGLVSGYVEFEDPTEDITVYANEIQKEIVKVCSIGKVSYDIDESNNVIHFDVELYEDATEKDIKELLKNINGI